MSANILVIEDDIYIQELIQEFLRAQDSNPMTKLGSWRLPSMSYPAICNARWKNSIRRIPS